MANVQVAKKAQLNLRLLSKDLVLKLYDLMVKARVLEERIIKTYKIGEGFFWIGGPGEEGFAVPLGLLAKKGQGIEYDWLHLHYRCTPTMVAFGMPMVDGLRLIMNRKTDPSTGGRNFAGHYCFPKWNVAPVTSTLEVQYGAAIGTAIAQKRHKTEAITIVSGGDAGTAEGDFASALIWSSRKGQELPMLITVQNNGWGISTAYHTQHGEKNIADRGKAFGIHSLVVDGNDPIECYIKLQEAMEYVRKERKPCLFEVMVSRLYGHSSADGANFRANEVDVIKEFEKQLLQEKYLTIEEQQKVWSQYENEARMAFDMVRAEPHPQPESVWDHVYANGENADWRKF